MRFLLLVLIVNAFATLAIAGVSKGDVEDFFDLVGKKLLKYPKQWFQKTPIGFGLEKLGKFATQKLFEHAHNEHKNAKNKFPANERDVIFWCTNSEKQSAEVKLNDPEINQKLNPNKPTNFIIHGFMSGLDAAWMNNTARDWVQYGECNVCAVDWSALAGKTWTDGFNYATVATKHTKQVAHVIIRFIKFLIDKQGLKISDISIAGHSLGAHIAGMVGAPFGGMFRAIYGLDPAGPGFTEIDDNDVKLDRSDARYVQCINTDGKVFGTEKDYASCHEHFHVNDAESQPGCLKSVLDFATCDHSRACDYFQESLDKMQTFWGIKMPMNNNVPIKDLMWSREVEKMGVYSARLGGNFSVFTNSESPYALTDEEFLDKVERLRKESPAYTFIKTKLLS